MISFSGNLTAHRYKWVKVRVQMIALITFIRWNWDWNAQSDCETVFFKSSIFIYFPRCDYSDFVSFNAFNYHLSSKSRYCSIVYVSEVCVCVYYFVVIIIKFDEFTFSPKKPQKTEKKIKIKQFDGWLNSNFPFGNFIGFGIHMVKICCIFSFGKKQWLVGRSSVWLLSLYNSQHHTSHW